MELRINCVRINQTQPVSVKNLKPNVKTFISVCPLTQGTPQQHMRKLASPKQDRGYRPPPEHSRYGASGTPLTVTLEKFLGVRLH